MKNKAFLLLAILFIASGCRKETPYIIDPRTENIINWAQAFESYWSGMNHNYVFWSIDPTDWDAVYRQYKPKFDALADSGFSNKAINNHAFEMIKEMSANLIDGHLAITFTLPDTVYWTYPASDRILQREDFHYSNDFPTLWLNAMTQLHNQGRISDFAYRSTDDMGAGTGIIDGNILYFQLTSFMLTEHYQTGDPIDYIITQYHNFIDTYPDLKGIIIDVRNNGGGYLADLPLVLGKFAEENHTICYNRKKQGLGRLDYTPWFPETLPVMEQKRKLDIPIVALADMYSVSMAEMTTMAILSLPKGCFIGERTWGGHGSLSASNEAFPLYYDGYFRNNVIEAYTTMTMLKDIEGNIYEGVGIPPTIEAPYDAASFGQGIDSQLERAIEYIKTGK